MSLVLDDSTTLAWCFEDELTPRVLIVIERVVESGAQVPSPWRYEVANGLLMAQCQQRIDASRRTSLLEALGEFSITEDCDPEGDPWRATVQLAELHQLTVRDAACLELAQRRRLPLATLDKALRSAAGRAGVQIMPA